ncbi:hypothetical protein EYF80_003435 [Liparis tanakae]|uniref:Uncharacterized protein n=1 Tax=Liparis tanakae TaxID=230148 RepID=A0A4Z2J8D6_9TELE|nr:hypothetical protein EYF80_003435 [Liparis tanakae]
MTFDQSMRVSPDNQPGSADRRATLNKPNVITDETKRDDLRPDRAARHSHGAAGKTMSNSRDDVPLGELSFIDQHVHLTGDKGERASKVLNTAQKTLGRGEAQTL